MTIQQISRIQHRRGLRIDLPASLNDAEFGWADDTRELFIGNGTESSVPGNTQILTEETSASVLQYSYISNIGANAITGFEREPLDPYVPSANYPTIRSYQEKFDDFVSVLDYGAIGDGSVDDAAAIRRAMFDLYDETGSPVAAQRKFRSLYFPAGTYALEKEILLYPNAVMIGDGPGRTIFKLTNAGVLDVGGDGDCVARTVDSKGQIGAAIDASAVYDPGNINVTGITFESETSNIGGYLLGEIDIVKLEDALNVNFVDCDFIGTWVLGATSLSRAIHIDKPGSTVPDIGSYTFDNCLFSKNGVGFEPVFASSNVYVVNSRFDTLESGFILGDSNTLDISLYRVSHSIFETIEDIGFDVQTMGVGNISTYNHYRGNGGSDYSIAAVRFAGLTDFTVPTDTTSGGVSLGDIFDIVTVFDCDDKLTNTRVQNRSLNNIVMNNQDAFQIPIGFCGNITIEGDVTITGTLLSGGTAITGSGGTPVIIIPYIASTGEAIFFDYVMRVPTEEVFRVGTLRVVHDGLGLVSGISYDETYAELNGPPTQPIALEAKFAALDTIEVTVIDPLGQALLPSFNFLPRSIRL